MTPRNLIKFGPLLVNIKQKVDIKCSRLRQRSYAHKTKIKKFCSLSTVAAARFRLGRYNVMCLVSCIKCVSVMSFTVYAYQSDTVCVIFC